MDRTVYSACYSNVPVYELEVEGDLVMRRRKDDYVNATHILKVAKFDKPARTRILEREVQKGTHEKVQGGYGKYQGTWIPLQDGRALADKNNILDKLIAIFDYVPGDRSPPPAPKHATAAAGKPKPRQAVQQRRVPVPQPIRQSSEISYDNYSQRLHEGTPDDASIITESEDDPMRNASFTGGSRKRKRNPYPQEIVSYEDQEFTIWADQLLDFFMLQRSDELYNHGIERPHIPPSIDLNRGLDNKGFTAMHWAAAMADIDLVRDLAARGARPDPQSASGGETPLMRSVMFTNNYDKQSMEPLIQLLEGSVQNVDYTGSNVFHHIANSTNSRSRYSCARYYLSAILDHLRRVWPPHAIHNILDRQDRNGDTPVLIAARNGARKCVRLMIENGARADTPNNRFETAEKLIQELNARRRAGANGAYGQLPPSSSPPRPSNGIAQHSDRPSSALPFETAERPAKKARYSSDAASLVASQLPDLLSNRVRALAEALEEDLKEKERESREAEFLLEQRKLEIGALRQQNEQVAEQHQIEDESKEQQLAREVQGLMDTCRGLFNAEMASEFNRILQQEQSAVQASDEPDEDAATKLRVLRAIRNAEAEHDLRQSSVLDAISTAGSEEKQALYRRVMASAMNVDARKVDGDLPDIIEELENSQGGAGKENTIEEHGNSLNGLARASVRMAGLEPLLSADSRIAGLKVA